MPPIVRDVEGVLGIIEVCLRSEKELLDVIVVH
jgi:hypothetical protein